MGKIPHQVQAIAPRDGLPSAKDGGYNQNQSHAAETVLQRKLVKEISERFMPLWKASGGRHGYVSIQGDPINEDDPGVIVQEARINREMNPNAMIKIPATKASLAAMDIADPASGY